MANSDQTSRILKADVGNNRTNNPDDVMRVKKILSHFGLYDLNQAPEPHGYMTADNKKRFEDSMVKGEVNGLKHPFKDQILRLRDGESIVLKNPAVDGGVDYWDQDIGATEGLRNFDEDQGLGIGRVKFRSTGSLKATRKGDKVLVDGLVDHRFNDVYDYNKDDKVLGALRYIPGSKPFKIYGSKLEKLNGEVSLERGTIEDHKFQWNSVSERNLR